MKDSIYKRQYDSANDGNRAVTAIVVTGTGTINTTIEDPEKGVYHWYLTLNLADTSPPRTVTLDSQPTNYPEATLIIKSQAPCADPHKVEVVIPTVNAPTASQIIDYMVSEGMARYVYADGGFGCRWWCRVALQKLEEKGWVEKGAEDRYVAVQKECAEKDPERFPTCLKKGVFKDKVRLSYSCSPPPAL